MTRIALVGLPGAGKSSIGRQLARRLDVSFVDSDPEIEKQLGCTIREFFAREGEASFRDVEAETIGRLSNDERVGVLATGGGAVLRDENRRALNDNCRVVYLHSTPEEVFRRVRNDAKRPLLQVDDPLKRLRDLYEVRDPLYREVAHYIIETGRPSVATIVNMILMQLELGQS